MLTGLKSTTCDMLRTIESKGALIGLFGILGIAVGLKVYGLLDSNLVSVLEWAGSSFFAAQSAAHFSGRY